MLECIQLKHLLYAFSLLKCNVCIRVVHVAPLYVEGQVQVLGAVHVPPFEHAGVQTAKISAVYIRFVAIKCTYVLYRWLHYMLKDKYTR